MIEWRPVVGYEGFYEVSSAGEVRSLPRQVRHYTGALLARAGRTLNGCVNAKGYVMINLCKDGTTRSRSLHSLVAEAFHGPRPPGYVVRHLDGSQLNNAAANIAYGTHQENSDDMRRHGRIVAGDAHPRALLTSAKVRQIRALSDTTTQVKLAEQFGMSVQQISNIVNRRQWRHI